MVFSTFRARVRCQTPLSDRMGRYLHAMRGVSGSQASLREMLPAPVKLNNLLAGHLRIEVLLSGAARVSMCVPANCDFGMAKILTGGRVCQHRHWLYMSFLSSRKFLDFSTASPYWITHQDALKVRGPCPSCSTARVLIGEAAEDGWRLWGHCGAPATPEWPGANERLPGGTRTVAALEAGK